MDFSYLADFDNIDLGDKRLDRRALSILSLCNLRPDESFPKQSSGDSELEAVYRFFGNPKVSQDGILAPHFEAAGMRVQAAPGTIIIHDTTDIESASKLGMRCHFSLAIRDYTSRLPLGVLSLIPIDRHPRMRKEKGAESEGFRWLTGIQSSRSNIGAASAIHIMDSEADSYALFAALVAANERFVIRNRHDRKVADETDCQQYLSERLTKTASVAEREVPISARRRGNKSNYDLKSNPLRDRRRATLKFAAAAIQLQRPRPLGSDLPRELSINVVHILEVDAPEGESPIEWILFTTEPISSLEEILTIVDIYRARWTIEEYFKALKTGCSLERRQLESTEALLNATALFVPIALQLLALRNLARQSPELNADTLFNSTRIEVLRHFTKGKLPAAPTMREAMLGVAMLGGHIKNNGDPGWQVLGRGFETLLAYEAGWLAATGEKM